tara:strand:+ start:396 stop:1823 length:1428 start_codon:yes stop_codon:yes gene_type:complete
MAYNTSNTETETNVYGNISKLKSLGDVYVLPTGDVWQGKVHKAEDGSYRTGEIENAASVYVVKVPLVPEFPAEGLVGREDIFSEVFGAVTTWSNAAEGNLTNLNSKIVELGKTIENNYALVVLALNKILNFIEQNNIQTESAGTGKIIDYELNYKLDTDTAIDHNAKIQTIEYEHTDSTPTYIFDGNAATGLTNEGLLSVRDKAISLDMVSRTGAPVELEEVSELLLLDHSYAAGFDGTIKIKVNANPTISHIDIPSNANISMISLDEGVTWLTDWSSFPAVKVSNVWIKINKVSPVPFTSYIATDLSADLLGAPQIDQYELSPPAYQRTELNIGKLKLSSISYAADKEFTSEPYFIKAGTLRSITMDSIEVMTDGTDYDSSFSYNLIIGGESYPITPWSRAGSNPKIYYINSALSADLKKEISSDGVGFIETGSKEVSFKLKVKLIRPSDAHITPEVKGVVFNYGTSLNGGIDG